MVIAGVITVGTAFNDTFTDAFAVIFTGEDVFVIQPSGSATITVNSAAGTPNIKLVDSDDGQKWQFRIVSDGSRMDIKHMTTQTTNISILSSNDNVGIRNTNPQESLDVNGNIRLTGNIVSPNDICIGNCP